LAQQHLASKQNESKQRVDISKKKRASAKVEIDRITSSKQFIIQYDSAAGKQRNSSGFSSK
jgi:hypothetical protein